MGILRTDKISGLETPTPVTGSVEFDGNDHLSIGSAGDFNFLHNGATDWTVEFWAKTGTATRQFVWGTGGSSAQTGFHLQIMSAADAQSDATGVFALVGRGAAGNYIGWGADNCLTVNTWHHIAAVFKSSDKTLALYVDGREVDNDSGTVSGTFAAANYSSSNSSYAFLVAKNEHADEYLTGDISNLRVVAGRRLYTSDFTPPVHALEPINGTRILCCNNPDSVTAVSNTDIGKGYTATASGDPTVSTDNPSLTRDFTCGTEFSGVTTFDTQGYFVPPSGTTEQRGRGRGVNSGGLQPATTNLMEFVNISTQGNAQDFGDLSIVRYGHGSCASSTRGIFGGGWQGPGVTADYEQSIDSFTIATTGNAIDFGDFATRGYGIAGCGSNTRGIFSGFRSDPSTYTNTMEYITIASLGSAATFGGLPSPLTVTHYLAGLSSPTRGVWAGGRQSPANYNTIYYVTIASTGDAIDFGDLSETPNQVLGASSSVRGIFGGGYTPSYVTMTQYITIASTGNAQDFGDLTLGRRGGSSMSNSNRALFVGGGTPGNQNTIDFFTISTSGDATDFGDLTNAARSISALSDSHGGLS